jgi:hypothetical protein
MLALNASPDSRGYGQEIWKLLVFDTVGRDVLSPLFKVGDLRREGITLHMYVSFLGLAIIPLS